MNVRKGGEIDEKVPKVCRQPCRLFRRWSSGRSVHRNFAEQLVSPVDPAGVRAAELGVCTGLEYFVPADSSIPVFRLEQRRAKKKLALLAFAFQLFLNMAWSAVFFGLRSPAGGFLVILVLIAAILWNIFLFGRISRQSALLLMPYLCWVGFAGYLNYGYWILNR